MTRLQEINLKDFTGGLNLRGNDFNLDPNESPSMLNIEIDPRGGFYTRNGWQRWNSEDVLYLGNLGRYDFTSGFGNANDPGTAVFLGGSLYLNNVDRNGIDRSADLAAITSGDTITLDDQWVFTVATSADNLTHRQFTGTAAGDEPDAGVVGVFRSTPNSWEPRNAELHPLSTGSFAVYVANDGTIYSVSASQVSVDLGIPCNASPHLADFASWGDVMYVACGRNSRPHKIEGGAATAIGPATAATAPTWNEDYTTPTGQTGFIYAEMCEPHAGYIFVADTIEGNVDHPNRVRWSHPGHPEDWASQDYIDIETGGGRITALLSFRDHLLIFKENSVWALYGYDLESWQLIQVSRSIGCVSPQAVTRSEDAAYFYSASARGGIYAYTGQGPIHLTEKLRDAMEIIQVPDDVWISWVGRRLWCSLPAVPPNPEVPRTQTCLVFDPEVGQGAWVAHAPATGDLTCFVEKSDLSVQYPLACAINVPGESPVMQLDFRGQASDVFNTVTGGVPFYVTYSTTWQYAGYPELRKSWRRPRFIAREPDENVVIRVDTFWNYQDDSPRRSHYLQIDTEGSLFWRAGGAAEEGGWDWDDGSLWGSTATAGAAIERSQPYGTLGGMGVARSVQLKFTTEPAYLGKAWGIDAAVLKFIARRFTT